MNWKESKNVLNAIRNSRRPMEIYDIDEEEFDLGAYTDDLEHLESSNEFSEESETANA